MKYVYPVILQPQGKDYYLATAPDLPGVVVGGNTLSEVLTAASNGCAMWLADAEAAKDPIPKPSDPNALTKEAGETVTLVLADTDVYRLMNESRTVKKAVSLPGSLADAADKAGLSLSKVLQDALRNRLGI